MMTLTSSPGASPVTVVGRPLRTGRPSTSTFPFGSEVDAVTTSESLAALDGTTANRAVFAAYAGHCVSAPVPAASVTRWLGFAAAAAAGAVPGERGRSASGRAAQTTVVRTRLV